MRRVLAVAVLAGSATLAMAQSTDAMPPETAVPAARPGTNAVLARALQEWPNGRIAADKHGSEWSYEQGVVLDGMIAEWRASGDGRLFDYARSAVDAAVDKEGVVHVAGKPFPAEAHSLDNIEEGRSVLVVYRVTQDKRYYEAAKFLHDQVRAQPKNASGGYWHKEIYPDQMWLDGAYMAGPFMANYARTFQHESDIEEVASQLLLMDAKMRDRTTGLLRHGWDESHKSAWADKRGLSPEVWARGMGWYAMALMDVLERMPDVDPQRAAVEAVAQRIMGVVTHYQDPETGVWWQVMDKGNRGAFTVVRGGADIEVPAAPAMKGNFPEASASCMFVYALLKGVRMGVLPPAMAGSAMRGWAGVQTQFVKADGTLSGTVKVSGLGGSPYRTGSFDYYTGEAVGDNDPKGVGAYLLADSEVTQHERAGLLAKRASGKTVLFDAWFNSETRKTVDGQREPFHYKYNDDSAAGYSFFSRMFGQYGMRSESLARAPRADDLKHVAVYILASPDSVAMNPNAHLMDKASAEAIDTWVRAGGVVLMMGNDPKHAELERFDGLAERFGVHFNPVERNIDAAGEYTHSIVPIPAGTGGVFRIAHTALEKDTCTITVSSPAEAVLTDKGDVVMAVSHAGRGVVFANVDPWLYNEFTDGRKAPMGEDNFAAGQELVRWIVGNLAGK